MKRLLLLLILLLPASLLYSQGFDKAFGIRGGWTPGFEYRFYSDDANSYKLLLGMRDQGLQFHAFKEFHQYDLFTFTDQLIFFYGIGIHVGYEQWDERYYQNNVQWYKTRTAPLTGLDGLAGLEYIFYEFPITLGFEVKPYFDIFGQHGFHLQPFDFAFTLKYRF